jgi:two-component sensor histidine kinase
MARDSVVSNRPVEIDVAGDLGEVTADVATPLAVTLAELLQNAVEHAFVEDGAGADSPGEEVGHVRVTLGVRDGELDVEVVDDGCGLPERFDLEESTSLGLSIVRGLVESQLHGSITMGTANSGKGTRVSLSVPATRPKN